VSALEKSAPVILSSSSQLDRSGMILMHHFKKKMRRNEKIKMITTMMLTIVHQMIVSMMPHSRFSHKMMDGFGGLTAFSLYLS